jgi:hypothetical protein
MGKGLAITGMVIAIILLLLFGLDLAIGIPFGQPSMLLDIGFVISSAILIYMAWSTYREQR